MPSSHSSITIFFATFITLQLFSSNLNYFTIISSSSIIYFTALSVVWSRVIIGHHTKSQVIVGMLLGLVCGILWNNLWWNFVKPLSIELNLNGKIGWKEIEIIINIIISGFN